MGVSATGPQSRAARAAPHGIDEADLRAGVAEVLDRWPSAGLAVGVVHGGSLEWFLWLLLEAAGHRTGSRA